MTTKARRERERKARENLILDTAQKIMMKKGMDRVSMRDIAWETELSKGTLYLYFKNREDLIHGIIARAMDKMLLLFQEAASRGRTGLDQIVGIGRAFIDFHDTNPGLARIVMEEETHEHDPRSLEENPCIQKCEDRAHQIFRLIVETIDRGVRDGTIYLNPGIRHLEVAMILWGNISGIMQLSRNKGGLLKQKFQIDLDHMLSGAISLLTRALENRTPGGEA